MRGHVLLWLVTLSFFWGCLLMINVFIEIHKGDFHLEMIIFTGISALANTALAFVAYWQLPAIEKTNKETQNTSMANFLLLMTEKWMHEDLIQARCQLHSQTLLATDKEHLQEVISDYIIDLSQKEDMESIRSFSRIISLLEFMETVSILCHEGHVKIDILQRLFGGSFERYFHYLHRYIDFRRTYGSPRGVTFKSDQFLYHNYETLVSELLRK